MPTKKDERENEATAPAKRVRLNLGLKPADYTRVCELAAESDTSEVSIISTALSLGLSVLEGPGGLEILEGVAMLRFLRGKP
jgi:hypothetical protein